jgi:transglutaminase-like putative cysteine protease
MICHLPGADAPLAADLAATALIDSAHPAIAAFARDVAGDAATARECVARLYLAVRDRVRYDPYQVRLTAEDMCASRTLTQGYGWCVPKAALLAAVCRACGVPARVGYADVRNHLSTRRMRALLDTDVYYWHSYTAIHLDGCWRKATPAFDLALCRRARLAPLEFDGSADSIFHPFDTTGRQHMEYLAYRGEYDDVPLQDIRRTFAKRYPNMMQLAGADFREDCDAEQPEAPRVP